MEFTLKLPNRLPRTYGHKSLTPLQRSSLYGNKPKPASLARPRREVMFYSGTSPILFYLFPSLELEN